MRKARTGIAAAFGVAVLALAGCGTSSSSTHAQSARTGTSTSTSTKPASSLSAIVDRSKSAYGPILTDGKGRSLYLWKGDGGSSSACMGACASAWPPLTTDGAAHARVGVIAAKLGSTKRSDGTTQVTYAGHPIYYFAGDSVPGQTNGQGSTAFGAEWDLVTASGAAAGSGSAGSGAAGTTPAAASSSSSGY